MSASRYVAPLWYAAVFSAVVVWAMAHPGDHPPKPALARTADAPRHVDAAPMPAEIRRVAQRMIIH